MCSATCDHTRARACNDPPPKYSGLSCPGNDSGKLRSMKFDKIINLLLEEDICWGGSCCPDDSEYIGCFPYNDNIWHEHIEVTIHIFKVLKMLCP